MATGAPLLLDARERVALVTGAAGGIGQAVIGLLRNAGARVAGIDVRALPLADLALRGDCAVEEDVESALESTVAKFGRLDYVVHAAGVVGSGSLIRTSHADWDRVVDANLDSAFLVARASYRALRATRGSLVLFASTNARNGGSHLSGAAYAVSKAGVLNLTRYLAREWAADGIRVNCVAPGPVTTPMLDRFDAEGLELLRQAIPLGRLVSAEEVAGATAFLCSSHAASMTGACMNVSGGLVLD